MFPSRHREFFTVEQKAPGNYNSTVFYIAPRESMILQCECIYGTPTFKSEIIILSFRKSPKTLKDSRILVHSLMQYSPGRSFELPRRVRKKTKDLAKIGRTHKKGKEERKKKLSILPFSLRLSLSSFLFWRKGERGSPELFLPPHLAFFILRNQISL